MNDFSIACFMAIARSGSFTIAATELSVTQQAVSRNIQSLESELGYSLINRYSNSAQLTQAGKNFYRWCSFYSNAVSLAAINADDTGLSAITVGWCDWTNCPPALEDGLRSFAEENPDVRITYKVGSMSEIQEQMENQLLDIAFLPGRIARQFKDVFLSATIAVMPLFLILSRRHPLASDETNIKDIFKLTHLSIAHGGRTPEESVRRVKLHSYEIGIIPNAIEILPSMAAVYCELLNNSGFAVSPAVLSEEESALLYTRELKETSISIISAKNQNRHNIWAQKLEDYLVGRSVVKDE